MDAPARDPNREKLIQAAVNGSPYYRHLKMRLTDFTDEGTVMEMEVRPEHKNLWGTMHGGALASLVDSSCGTAASILLGPDETIVTIDLRTQYIRAAREGMLRAESKVVARTSRYLMAECEIFDGDRNLVARGSTIHSVIQKKA